MSFPYHTQNAVEENHDRVCMNCGTTWKGKRKNEACPSCQSRESVRFLKPRAADEAQADNDQGLRK